MNELLDFVIDAHGGWERWKTVSKLEAHASIGGGIWHLKGWPDALADSRIEINTKQPAVRYSPFAIAGQHSCFEPENVAISDSNGVVTDERASPRESFRAHTISTPWDALDLAYFSGYAIWTYLTTPFLFKMPGFISEEIECWDEAGETWRRLKVSFPEAVPSHCREQIFYFDQAGMMRRHDYSVDILGGTSSANYASDYIRIDGLVFPKKRRVYARDASNKPILDRLAVSIDFHSFTVS